MRILRLRSTSCNAFTIIEITFSIVVLASSLVVLLGLQGASVQRTVRDQNVQQAMLLSRELLAAIEIRPDPETISDNSGSVDEIYRDLLGGLPMPDEALDPEQRFRAEVAVGEVTIPLGVKDPEIMKRVQVILSWSDAPVDRFVVDYFVPIPAPAPT